MNPGRTEILTSPPITPEQFATVLAANHYHFPQTLRALGISIQPNPPAEQTACQTLLANVEKCLTPFAQFFSQHAVGPATIFSEGPYPYGQQLKAEAFKPLCPEITWLSDQIGPNKSTYLPELAARHRQYTRTIIVEDKLTEALKVIAALAADQAVAPSSAWPHESEISTANSTEFTRLMQHIKTLCPTQNVDYPNLMFVYVPPDKQAQQHRGWGPTTTSFYYPRRIDALLSFAQTLGLNIAVFSPSSTQTHHTHGNLNLARTWLADSSIHQVVDLDGPIFPQTQLIALLAHNASLLLAQSKPNQPFSLAA